MLFLEFPAKGASRKIRFKNLFNFIIFKKIKTLFSTCQNNYLPNSIKCNFFFIRFLDVSDKNMIFYFYFRDFFQHIFTRFVRDVKFINKNAVKKSPLRGELIIFDLHLIECALNRMSTLQKYTNAYKKYTN